MLDYAQKGDLLIFDHVKDPMGASMRDGSIFILGDSSLEKHENLSYYHAVGEYDGIEVYLQEIVYPYLTGVMVFEFDDFGGWLFTIVTCQWSKVESFSEDSP